jgi:hypothetical protein
MDRALKTAVCCPLRRHDDCRWGNGWSESSAQPAERPSEWICQAFSQNPENRIANSEDQNKRWRPRCFPPPDSAYVVKEPRRGRVRTVSVSVAINFNFDVTSVVTVLLAFWLAAR